MPVVPDDGVVRQDNCEHCGKDFHKSWHHRWGWCYHGAEPRYEGEELPTVHGCHRCEYDVLCQDCDEMHATRHQVQDYERR